MMRMRPKKKTLNLLLFFILPLPVFLIYLLITKFKMFKTVIPVVKSAKIRNDSQGCGHYGASRGSRKHDGVDYLIEKGQPVIAPYDGEATRYSYPYVGDRKYKGIVFKGLGKASSFYSKIWYFEPLRLGVFRKGEVLGYAQAISEKYSSSMKDHIHWLLRKEGLSVDPQKYV